MRLSFNNLFLFIIFLQHTNGTTASSDARTGFTATLSFMYVRGTAVWRRVHRSDKRDDFRRAITPFTISVSTLARRRDAASAPSVSPFAAARSVAALGGGQCVGDATGQSRAR